LVDLTDSVAEVLKQLSAVISIEMIYRSLYFFTQARQRSQTDDLVAYLADNAKLLGIVKRKRRTARPSPLISILTVSLLP